jgi:alpha-1,2-mannosyltransferase
VVAALLLLASAVPMAYDLYKIHHLMVPGAVMIGRDFLNCWVGANLAFHGPVSRVWSPDYMRAARALTGLPLGTHNFSYPPPLLLFIWPLALLPYLPALLVWLGATGAAFLAAARPYFEKAKLPWWTAALIPAVLINIWAGHHGFVLAALWLAAFAFVGKRPVLAGILIALLTLKPHMGVLIPLVLLLRRQWTAIGVAAAATLVLVLVSGLLFGWQAWAGYWTWTAHLQADMLLRTDPLFFQFMPTAYVSVWLATGSFAAAVAAQIILGLAAVAVVVRASLSDIRWPLLGLLTATATFLVLPYAFNYDMGVVGLSAAILLFGEGKRLHWAGRIVALFAFGTPILVLGANYERIPLLPLLLLAFLWVQYRAYAPRTDKGKAPERARPGALLVDAAI